MYTAFVVFFHSFYGLAQSAQAATVWEFCSNSYKEWSGHWHGVEPGRKGVEAQAGADMMGMAWGASLPPPLLHRDGVNDILLMDTYNDYQGNVGKEFGQWKILKDKPAPTRSKLCQDPDNRALCLRKGWIQP